jgi:hypothetical protein
LLDIEADRPVLFVRFAGNEVGVKHQVEQALALMNGDGELVFDDAYIWQGIAEAPLRQTRPGWRTSILPSKLATHQFHFTDPIWQIGAADGRVRMSAGEKLVVDSEPRFPADALMQRVKQQLDPTNKFGA